MSKSKYAAFFFSLILISSLALTSCGKTDMYNLDGRWKFDDGSSISFDTKSHTYSARGDVNSTSGNMEIYNFGVLQTTDVDLNNEYYELQICATGFIINFQDMEITMEGKNVQRLEDLNGKYKAVLSDSSDLIFNFKKKKGKLTVISGKTKADFKYSVKSQTEILFTSGGYEGAESLPVEFIDASKIRISGETLTR
ncbi:MAG: hypothetical protein II461_03905 [Treponema sp.]|nr:hypothetical protein [Treponema sp.]